ncbi:MAG: YciI family protein [bacterium]
MQFMVLIYNDPTLLDALPKPEFNSTMRECLSHADELRQEGHLIESRMLQGASTARSIRVRGGRQTIYDGPFTEAKEILGGFNLIEANDMDEAVRIAATFPWVRTGRVEVRPLEDIEVVRQRVSS